MPVTTLGPHTVKDWLATPEGEHWELIHGNLIMTEETFGNSSLAVEILGEIRDHLIHHPLGIVRNNVAFHFPGIPGADREGVVPDLCYIPNDQLSKLNLEANAQKGVIPALVAEMLSPSSKKTDLVDKVEIYREAGVQEYWIFDRGEETVRIYRFAENPEEPIALKSFEDTLTTPLLPGLSLELPRIWRALSVGRKPPRQGSMQ